MSEDAIIALANLIVGFISCAANIAVLFLHAPSPAQPTPRLQTESRLAWRVVIISMTVLTGSFALLLRQTWLSGAINRWFVRIHFNLAIATGFAGGAVLIYMIAFVSSSRPKRGLRRLGVLHELLIITSLFFLSGYVTFGWQFVNWERLYPSARMAQAGFESFNGQDYERASRIAQECVDDFGGAASRIEKGVADKQFPEGKVSAQMKTGLFENGALNDVGACSWIVARSAQLLKREYEAKKAYDKVREYPHAGFGMSSVFVSGPQRKMRRIA
jgi:hypothetical protein